MEKLLISAVAKLDEDKVLELVRQGLKEGKDPSYLQKQLQLGMEKVGQLYEKGEYFIADLIMAGMICKEVLKIEEMKNDMSKVKVQNKAKILLGTVYGDLHDIGKDVFGGMMESAGFEVYDLGVDVPAKVFVDKVREVQPDILGLSGVLTYVFVSMKDVIDELKKAGLRDKVKVIIGGSAVTKEVCEYIGADNFTDDALRGVEICKSWIDYKL